MGPTSDAALPEQDYAVLLNASARRVSEKVAERLAEVVPPANLFVTRSEEEGADVTRRILDAGFGTVFTGGGDGTVVKFIGDALEHAERTGGEAPYIGILRLGTGNALAQMVSSGDYLVDIEAFVRNAHRDVHVLPLLEGEGRRFPFAGVGWDAEFLNDYVSVKEGLGDTFLRPAVQNVGGYFAALFAYTIPRRLASAFKTTSTVVRVTNTGSVAELVQADGTALATIAPGEVLFEGRANVVMAGTCPYYGYGLKVLPFATARPDRMHLRVVTLGIPKAIANLPDIWKGVYKGTGLVDFLVDRVHVEAESELPYQEAGDARGHRREIDFALSDVSVRLLRFI